MVRGESTGSYYNSNELYYIQESITKRSKDPNSATLCRYNNKEAYLLRYLGMLFLSRIKGVVG